MVLVMPPGHRARRPRPVEELLRLQIVLPGHDAHAQADAGGRRQSVELVLQTVQDSPIVFRMPAVNVETIRSKSARDAAVFVRHCEDLASENAQDVVAELSAVQSVHGMELLDVQHDGVHRRL